MQDDDFEWDDDKAASNLAKHKISFVAAQIALVDPDAVERFDFDPDEDRFVTLGMANGILLSIITTQRGDRTRIISARKATKNEQRQYDQGEAAP